MQNAVHRTAPLFSRSTPRHPPPPIPHVFSTPKQSRFFSKGDCLSWLFPHRNTNWHAQFPPLYGFQTPAKTNYKIIGKHSKTGCLQLKIDTRLSWESEVRDFSHTFSNKILPYSYVYAFIIYAEKIKLEADVKRKENNRLHDHISYTILNSFEPHQIQTKCLSKMLMNLRANPHKKLVWFYFMNWQTISGYFCFPRTKPDIYHWIRTHFRCAFDWSCLCRYLSQKLHLFSHLELNFGFLLYTKHILIILLSACKFAMGTQQLLLLAAQMLLKPVYTGYFCCDFCFDFATICASRE